MNSFNPSDGRFEHDTTSRQNLLAIMKEARLLLARPDNDFMWSSWEGEEDALREVDGIIETLKAGRPITKGDIAILFAPTGPLQEVAISSGWGNAFLALADRFDAVRENSR